MKKKIALFGPLVAIAGAFSLSNILPLSREEKLTSLERVSNLPEEESGQVPNSIGLARLKKTWNDTFQRQVMIPCSECAKIVHGYVQECVFMESQGKSLLSVREWCERNARELPGFTEYDLAYCQFLGQRLAERTGTSFAAVHTNNHLPGTCARFQAACETFGGGPECYSGFCDEMASCVDCPTAVLSVEEGVAPSEEVCGDRGVCRMADKKRRVGYCKCEDGYRGVACNGLVKATAEAAAA